MSNSSSPISTSTAVRQNANVPMSDIEQSVSRLLMSTKKLLETLTAWSSGNAPDTQVYDEYCVLEVYFANTTRAFESAQLPMDDMLHLPDDLYSSLKATLSKEPSSVTLEEHLPVIRDTILKLLHGLKQKQSMLRDRLERSHNNKQERLQHQQHHSKNLLPLHTHALYNNNQQVALPLPTPTSSTEPPHHFNNNDISDHSIPPQSPISVKRKDSVQGEEEKEENEEKVDREVNQGEGGESNDTKNSDSDEFDMDDPSTKDALDALNLQENLARRSSVRRASLLSHHSLIKDDSPPPPSTIPNSKAHSDGDYKQSETIEIIPFYIQKGEKVKKVALPRNQVSLKRLKDLFYDRFSGLTSFEIYILDPNSDVRYELENSDDVKPYSVLSVKELNSQVMNQIRNLFEEMLQQLISKLPENSTTTSITSVAHLPAATIREQKQELENLRCDMTALTRVYENFKGETSKLIDNLKEKSRQLGKSEPKSSSEKKTLKISAERVKMIETKDSTRKSATAITTRLEELQDMIDQIKLDVTQRRCRPSKAQLKHCEEESKILQKEMDDLSNNIKVFKPVWKKTWETELQDIVNEQQFLKDQEALLVDLKEDHDALLEVLDQLVKISEIQERKHHGIEFRIAPMEEGFEGMPSVMKQVSSIHVDHNRRIKALDQAEKMRARELAQRIDAFEEELSDFVGCNKLKKIGGAEAIDRQRQEKDQALIKQIFDKNAKNDFTQQQMEVSQKKLDKEDVSNPTLNKIGIE